jgi:AraC-like DNA-binding protein
VGRVDAPTFLLARRLARELRDEPDRLLVEETAAELVGCATGEAVTPSGRRPATRRVRAELAEAAKELLVARLAQPLSLGAMAEDLNVSPFHLTRVFRERTGRTRPDLAIGSYLNSDGAPGAGKIELYSGATGAKLRTITSTTAGENLGFDNVGVGDVNRDHRADLLASAAEGDTVYMIAGTGRRGPRR